MKYYVLDDYRKDGEKQLNKKKVIKTIAIFCAIVIFAILFSLYVASAEFRGWIDKYIFRKEITENTGAIIETDDDSNSFIYAYDNYIIVLNKNTLHSYSSSGEEVAKIDITITNPLFASSGRYLCVAEKSGNKLYLISGSNIIWQKDLEDPISQIYVNKNGYVSVSHKTIVKLFSLEGRDVTTAYLSSTCAIDSVVSNDNSELAIAEINYSGSIIQSSVKIISIEKAQTDANNAVIYTYKAEAKSIITNLYYQDNDTLICMFDNKILKRNGEEIIEETTFGNDTLFADINLNGYTVEVKKKSTGLFSAEAQVEMKQVSNEKINLYKVDALPKAMETYQDVIALNLGTEVHFIHTNGWLIKKYTSTRDIKDVVICANVAGIIYKDKIELVNL